MKPKKKPGKPAPKKAKSQPKPPPARPAPKKIERDEAREEE